MAAAAGPKAPGAAKPRYQSAIANVEKTRDTRDAWLDALSAGYIRKLADFGIEQAMKAEGPVVFVDATAAPEGKFNTASTKDAGPIGKHAEWLVKVKREGRFPVLLRVPAAAKGESTLVQFVFYFPPGDKEGTYRLDASGEDIRKYLKARYLQGDALAFATLAADDKVKVLLDAYITSGMSGETREALRQELGKYTILKEAKPTPAH